MFFYQNVDECYSDIFLFFELEVKLTYRAYTTIIKTLSILVTKINAFTLSKKI